ncbi:MAG: class I SAM-dependent methyltransferase [Natronospirillum sp.]
MTAEHACRLCHHTPLQPYAADRRRAYWYCFACHLVQVAAVDFLSAEEEKAQYDTHVNDVNDPRYRAFLSRTATPLLERLKKPGKGLDFGCGPGPLLAKMMTEAGHSVAVYDAFYHPDQQVLNRTYDFITATEVAEHLHAVDHWLDRLWDLLMPGGWLAVQTRQYVPADEFPNWYYKNDLTHVSFFSPATFAWLADRWSAHLEVISDEVVLLQKPLS